MIQELITQLEIEFEKNRNEQESIGMARYMKNRFDYFGIKKPIRAEIQKKWFNAIPSDLTRDQRWDLVLELWQKDQREFHYTAMDWMSKWKTNDIHPSDSEQLEFLLTNNSWWDSVDNLASNYLSRYMAIFPDQKKKLVANWRNGENMWLRRSCLIFQLKYYHQTDFNLLKDLIQQFKFEKEFFIQKAIGWSLRQYAKTEPELVRLFVDESGIQGLARREALKHLSK